MTLSELIRGTYELFRPPKKQTVSEWADENRVLVSESSAEPGRWNTDRAPYQREIMDAFTQPGVYQVVVMASAQVGKSEIELNMMGRAIDIDPGPMMYVQPTDSMAEQYSKQRVAPMLDACPSLREKISLAKGRDAGNTITVKTFPGGLLMITGANSPSELRSKPIRYLFLDEVDAYPASAGTEGDPVELASRRTETFRVNRKIVLTSTPGIKGKSRIEAAYMEGTQEIWETECPHCRNFNFIRFEDIKFDKEQFKDFEGNPDWVVTNSRWVCPICKRETREHDAKRLPAKWVSHNEKAIKNGVRSFRLNAFMSPWSDWNDIAHKFLRAKDDPELLKVFTNTMLGESWEMKAHSDKPEKLYDRREHYDAEVPDGVLVLTMGIDTQDNRLEYEVVGWDRNEQSWGIQYGIIPARADTQQAWDAVDELLEREWKRRDGTGMRVLATFMDSGGHFTQEVYRECAKRSMRRIWPIKGEGGEGKQYVRMMGKSAKGADMAFIVAVDAGKEAILYSAGLQEEGPRYMHWPDNDEAGYSVNYFYGLLSEKMVIKRRNGKMVTEWEKFYERNEPLDLRNYARAAYKYFHWNFTKYEAMLNGAVVKPMTHEEAERKKPKRVISKGITV